MLAAFFSLFQQGQNVMVVGYKYQVKSNIHIWKCCCAWCTSCSGTIWVVIPEARMSDVQNPSDIPLYWLVYRDRFHVQSQYIQRIARVFVTAQMFNLGSQKFKDRNTKPIIPVSKCNFMGLVGLAKDWQPAHVLVDVLDVLVDVLVEVLAQSHIA